MPSTAVVPGSVGDWSRDSTLVHCTVACICQGQLLIEELNAVFPSPDIFRVIQPRIGWPGHVAGELHTGILVKRPWKT